MAQKVIVTDEYLEQLGREFAPGGGGGGGASVEQSRIRVANEDEYRGTMTELLDAGKSYKLDERYADAVRVYEAALDLSRRYPNYAIQPKGVSKYTKSNESTLLRSLISNASIRLLTEGGGGGGGGRGDATPSSADADAATRGRPGGGGGDEGDDGKLPTQLPIPEPDMRAYPSLSELQGISNIRRLIEQNVIMPFQFPNLYQKLQTLLMYGPPGTGKTEVARGLTKTLRSRLLGGDVNNDAITLYTAQGSSLKGKYVGETEKNTKSFYVSAEERAREKGERGLSVIFMDEFDAIAGDRKKATSPLDRLAVNELLTLLDGVKGYPRVFTLAATNEPWQLDSAILSRFKQKIFADVPNTKAREEFFKARLCKLIDETLSPMDERCTSWDNTSKEEIKENIAAFVKKATEMTGMHPNAVKNISSYINSALGRDKTPCSALGIQALQNTAETKGFFGGKSSTNIDACDDAKVDNDYARWNEWLRRRGHVVTPNAVHMYGYTFRDLGGMMAEWINWLATRKLRQNTSDWPSDKDKEWLLEKQREHAKTSGKNKRNVANCCFIPPPDSTCKPCASNLEDKRGIRLYLDDIFGRSAFNDAMDKFRSIVESASSSAKTNEYPRFIFYFLEDTEPPFITSGGDGGLAIAVVRDEYE